MAANTTDWVSYYRANRGDGGTIEALYALDDDELAEIAKGHNNDSNALRTAIAENGGEKAEEEGGRRGKREGEEKKEEGRGKILIPGFRSPNNNQ